MKVLEDRYGEASGAWERQVRELIDKCKIKAERVVFLEGSLSDVTLKKNELQYKLDSMEQEIKLLNKALSMYGVNIDEDKLNIDNLKRVFEENQKLKQDIEKLLENIEYSR